MMTDFGFYFYTGWRPDGLLSAYSFVERHGYGLNEMWVVTNHLVMKGVITTDLIYKSHSAHVPYPTVPHSEQKCAHVCYR